jgi:hypothetical protein
MSGKAGSYRNNVSISVWNPSVNVGGISFLVLSTQWSFFEMSVSKLTTATLAMTNPTFGSNNMSPLSTYMTNGMYITVIPFVYTSSVSLFNIYCDNVHMPYNYDLPSYFLYTIRSSDQFMTSSNAFVMTNANSFYTTPLKSLTISCQDNAIGVINTYCTIIFGTQNPLLASGNIRISVSGMTVSTNVCYLYSNGTSIPVTCSSSTDNKNVTVAMTGW